MMTQTYSSLVEFPNSIQKNYKIIHLTDVSVINPFQKISTYLDDKRADTMENELSYN